MKISISRKGFDSQYGRIPSPILPDGRLVPLPIPSDHDSFTMRDLKLPGVDLDGLLGDLSNGRLGIQSKIHLDPDLDRPPTSRHPGWRPTLGQTGAAQGHLARQNFGSGDVFLFFGWFREVELVAQHWRYVRAAPHQHVLFGWLEVDEVLPIVLDRTGCLDRHPWILDHPHVSNPGHYNNALNQLYVARSKSRFVPKAGFGAGKFPMYQDRLRLTLPGSSRTVWRLPEWCMPTEEKPPLSYHPLGPRWSKDAQGVVLKSAAKGQEFVLDADFYPEAEPWLANLLLGAF
jgi:Nucleotide modification associated domain 3